MRLAIIPFLLLTYLSSFSQQFISSISEKTKYKGTLDLLQVGENFFELDFDNNTQLAYTFKLSKIKYSMTINKYDKNMKLVSKYKISDGEKVFGPFPPALKKINEKLYLFYYQLGNQKESIKVFYSEINSQTLQDLNSKEIFEIDQKNLGLFNTVFDNSMNHRLITNYSPNHNRILLVWCALRTNRIFYSIFDSSMNILQNKREEISETKELFIKTACVDNSGNVFIGFNVSNLYVRKFNGDTKTFIVNPENSKTYEYFISPSSDKDILYISGIFSEGIEKQKGVFSQSLNTTTLTLSPVLKTNFPKEITDKLWEQLYIYYGKSKKFFASPIEFSAVIKENGQIDLLGKSLKETNYQSYYQRGGITNETVYGSFVYVHINENNTLFTKIPKVTSHSGQHYSFCFKNKTYIFLKDHEDNLNQDLIDFNIGEKEKLIVMAVVLDNGSLKREIISTNNLALNYSIQMTPSSFLIPETNDSKKNDFFWTTIQTQ